MSEIVNLRSARKTKGRAEAACKAAENRLRFGAPKAERERTAATRESERRHLEGHRRESEPGSEDA
jgi:Domain of unknown function (DUF4169)